MTAPAAGIAHQETTSDQGKTRRTRKKGKKRKNRKNRKRRSQPLLTVTQRKVNLKAPAPAPTAAKATMSHRTRPRRGSSREPRDAKKKKSRTRN